MVGERLVAQPLQDLCVGRPTVWPRRWRDRHAWTRKSIGLGFFTCLAVLIDAIEESGEPVVIGLGDRVKLV